VIFDNFDLSLIYRAMCVQLSVYYQFIYRSVVMQISLSSPDITEREIQAVCEVLRTPQLALGPKMRQFEENFTKYTGRKRAVSVNSGTSGLFLCMKALGIKEGDEVITTPFTFIATVNVIMMVGATPVFADINPDTLNIDPEKIEDKITEKTKAILPIEAFGNPADMDKIEAIAKKHNLTLVEDSCEGLGSELDGRKVGTFGKMSVFAFYPNKQITTGEGGMILTDDDRLADMCLSLRNQGRGKGGGWLGHQRLGYNFRLSDINSALGIVQLSRIDEIKAKRRQVVDWYSDNLKDDRIILPSARPGCDMSWFVFVVRLADNPGLEKRNTVLKELSNEGVQASNYFPPAHLQPFIVEEFGFKEGDFPVTESIFKSTVALPFHNNLDEKQVITVCEKLKGILDKI
jgi:perosamine synthetase